MSDKPRTDMQGSARETDNDRQRQQPGGTQQQYSTDQYGDDRGGNGQAGNDEGGNDEGGDGQQGALKPALRRARHALEEGVERQAQHLQERARNTGEQISEALGAAAKTLDGDQSWLAGPAQDLAQSVRRLTARGLGSPAEMKARVTDFARRHPAWALAGAVAVGFAAARFLKTTSSASDSDHHRFVDHDPNEAEEAGLAERPDAVPGAQSGERFHG
jgi:hypothetical protein